MKPGRDGALKRSVSIAGHRTSVSLEAPFWEALGAIARERGQPLQALIGAVDATRGVQNLASALRVFVLTSIQTRLRPEEPDPDP